VKPSKPLQEKRLSFLENCEDYEVLCFLGGEENFLKKAFLPRTPSFKNFETGVWGFIVIIALNARTAYVRTTPKFESFGQAFSKACGFGQRP
jgi:hypothetical protein